MINFDENLGLVYAVMKNFRSSPHYDDLLSAGMVGLWEATKKFDPKKGAFSTYATAMIRGRIMQERTQWRKLTDGVELTEEPGELDPNLDALEIRETVNQLLARTVLSNTERMIIRMYYCRDMRLCDIASKLNLKPGSVRQIMYAGIRKMRRANDEGAE